MRIGVALPTHLGAPPDPRVVLEWARRADEAGFAALAVHDRPNHWTWEPLVTLAAVAPLTRDARLMTTALLLPTRSEGLVAKQAAVVDHLSGGRLDLGVAVGGRPDDFETLGIPFERRGRRFEQQLAALVGTWADTRDPGRTTSTPGPPPLQQPHPPLWIGGYADAAVTRTVRHGAGYLFGAAGSAGVARRAPAIREAAAQAGREIEIGALAYVAADVGQATAQRAEEHLLGYYGTLHRPFDELVHVGDGPALVDELRGYADAGTDLLILMPTLPEVEQLDRLAADVLPGLGAHAR